MAPQLWIVAAFAFLAQTASAQSYPDLRFVTHERQNFEKYPELSHKVDVLLETLEDVANSDEFRRRILSYRTCVTIIEGECQYEDGFHFESDDTPISREDVLDRIYAGVERYPAADTMPELRENTADLYLRLYYTWKRVIGYTSPKIRTVNINRRYLDSESVSYMAGNLIHEWLHKLGFRHRFKKARIRSYSVPYAVGGIVRELSAVRLKREGLSEFEQMSKDAPLDP